MMQGRLDEGSDDGLKPRHRARGPQLPYERSGEDPASSMWSVLLALRPLRLLPQHPLGKSSVIPLSSKNSLQNPSPLGERPSVALAFKKPYIFIYISCLSS